ncbi:hypothetical protein B0T16DRAFT_78318 [Cercophora newfieldiana]|uniref:Secreted protein n=1 Tax=Cercophora newfieldiana TaxID=92897 RepID=A0AA39YH33_9PEZI|nr:hypothetical protein B0T16DRAFT_78318 [Cercophora newfieldiana]
MICPFRSALHACLSLACFNTFLLYNILPESPSQRGQPAARRHCRNVNCRGGAIPRPGPLSINEVDPHKQGWQGLLLRVFFLSSSFRCAPQNMLTLSALVRGIPGHLRWESFFPYPLVLRWRRVRGGRGGSWLGVWLHGWCRHPVGRRQRRRESGSLGPGSGSESGSGCWSGDRTMSVNNRSRT